MSSNPHNPEADQLLDIKNIVFDFGNVLLDIDYTKSYDSLTQLLGYNVNPTEAPATVVKAMNEYEMGLITMETFLWNFQHLATKEMPQGRALIDAWNGMLIGLPEVNFDFLLRIRKKYNVYLLSNTNEIHLDWVYRYLKSTYQITDWDTRYFTKTYYSHLVGMRKPNDDIYTFVQHDATLEPCETLFFDDIIANLEAPAKLGWMTYHHDPCDSIIDVVENKLRMLG